jgi:hypothetical protein
MGVVRTVYKGEVETGVVAWFFIGNAQPRPCFGPRRFKRISALAECRN